MTYFKLEIGNCLPRTKLVLVRGKLEIPVIRRAGQSLVEILIAIGLVGILLPALLTGLISSREGKAQEGQRLQAAALIREGEEAVRSVREKGWTNIAVNGTYHPVISGSEWTLQANPETVNGYTRQVVIADAQRDPSTGNIVTSGGTPDNSTKEVETTVSWSTPFSSSLQTISYYQRYLGNSAFTHTSQAEFAAGTHNNTQAVATGGGAVELTQSVGGGADYGNKFRVTATSAIGNMTSSAMKTSLRFTAQSSKTPSAIRVYLQSEVGTSPTYRLGIQANSGTSPSGVWLCSNTLVATSAGWKTISLSGCPQLSAGAVYHIVVEYASGTISTSRYIALRRSAPQNLLYPQTQAADPQSNTLFNSGASWTAQGFQPIYELDFSDATFEGNPYETNTATSIFGSNFIGEKFKFSNPTANATTVSFYVRQNSATEPLDSLRVVLWNADTNSLVEEGVLATAAQTNTTYAYFTYTFTTPRALTNNVNYRIYLKSPSSNATNFYQVYRVTTTNAANYNSITYDGTNSVYTLSANSGSTWTDTNINWDIGGFYFQTQGTNTYSANGTYESQASGSFDAGAPAAFNNLTWTANVPGGTSLTLQVAVSNNASGPWDYFGADGNLGSSFTSPAPIPLNRINGRYLRYKATFTSNGSATPSLNDVSINYSP